MENNELYHHGVQGQKWGVRRYQNEDGSLTPEGRSHYGYSIREAGKKIIKSLKEKHASRSEQKKKNKQKKERIKRLEKARKAKVAKKAHEEAKKKAIESGSAEQILKFKNELTAQQRNDVIQRLNTESNLRRLASEDRRLASEEAASKSKWNKLIKLTDKAGQLSTAIENSSKLYNSFTKVYNTFADEPLPTIGEKKQKENFINKKAKEILKNYKDMPVSMLSDEDITNRISRESRNIKNLNAIRDATK